jgi:hypothetical protein
LFKKKISEMLILTLKITQAVNLHNKNFLGRDAKRRWRCVATWACQRACKHASSHGAPIGFGGIGRRLADAHTIASSR